MFNKKCITVNNFYKILIIALYALAGDYSLTALIHLPSTFITFMVLVLLNIYYPRIYKFLTIIVGVLVSIYLPLQIMYGHPSIGMMTSLLHTNSSESTEFISNIPNLYIGLAIVLFILAVIASRIRLKIIPNKLFHIFSLTFVVVLVITPVTYCLVTHKRLGTFPILYFAQNVNRGVVNTIVEEDRLKVMLATPDGWKPTVSNGKYNTFIMVIGESARKDFLHAYGFKFDNTPFMDQANGDLYSNYYSAGPNTVISLLHSFSLNQQGKPQIQNNIISLANKAGFKTYWFSNQGTLGVDDTSVAAIGKRAKVNFFTKVGDSGDGHTDDSVLLPYVKSALNNESGNKLIVVHLMGSHSKFCERTHNQYDQYFLSKDISCYQQSIKNTDTLLRNITELANSSHSKWSLMYFSDHGLRIAKSGVENNNITLLHGDETIQNYNVPLFISYFDSNQHKVFNQKYDGMSFISMFSKWTGINDIKIPNDCNPLSGNNCDIKQVNAVNIDDVPLNVLNLHDDSISKYY